MSKPAMTYEAWRLGYQSDDAAARAAFAQVTVLAHQVEYAKARLSEIASAPRADFEDKADFLDWAQSRAGTSLETLMAPGISRSPGVCLGCGQQLGKAHIDGCRFAAFVPGAAA